MEVLRSALKIEPSNFEARINLGTALYLTKAYEEAMEHFQYVLAIDRNQPMALLNLAACYDALGDLDRSITTLEELMDLCPDWRDGHYNLAIAYLKVERREKAREALRRELQLNPDHRQARDLLNHLYNTLDPPASKSRPPSDTQDGGDAANS